MSAFRGHALPCPSCPSAPLRMFERRLICDTCQGMLLTDADLGAALADTAGVSVELELTDEQPDARRCPRCVAPMTAFEVAALRVELGRFARCQRHGLWLEGGQLVDALTKIGRAAHSGVGGGAAYGGVRGNYRVAARRRPRRRARARPALPEARPPRSCPGCGRQTLQPHLERWACTACRAVFVGAGRVEEMVMEMLGEPWQLPEGCGVAGARGCPLCGAVMTVEALGAATLERCSAHGLWFEAGALELLLGGFRRK